MASLHTTTAGATVLPVSWLPVGTPIALKANGILVQFSLQCQKPGLTAWKGNLVIERSPQDDPMLPQMALPVVIHDNHGQPLHVGHPILTPDQQAWFKRDTNPPIARALRNAIKTAYTHLAVYLNMDLHRRPLRDWPLGAPVFLHVEGYDAPGAVTPFYLTGNDANKADFVAHKTIDGVEVQFDVWSSHDDGLISVDTTWPNAPVGDIKHNLRLINLNTSLEITFLAFQRALPKVAYNDAVAHAPSRSLRPAAFDVWF